MKTALLPINTSTYFSDLFRLAKALRDEKSHVPVILFVADYPTRPGDIQACESEGIAFRVDPSGGAPEAAVPSPAKRGLSRFVAAIGRRVLPQPEMGQFKAHLRHQRSRIAFASRALREQKADVLVLAGNLIHYDAPAFVAAAHSMGVPAIVAPSWMAGPLEAAEALHHLPASSTRHRYNGAFARIFPRWTFHHKGKDLLRLSAPEALAMEVLKLAPPRPWVLHSGHHDATAVESEAMRDYCIEEGLPPAQIRVTGSAAHDVMARVRERAADAKAELCAGLSLDPSKPLILSAVPPDMLYTGGRKECEFTDYPSLLEHWIRSLCEIPGHNVVLNLHPSQKYEEWRHLERLGARISPARIETLIPICDVFVASISSTIQWAIACGKPVVNFDVYLYRYKDYAKAHGVLLAEKKDDFVALLKRITGDRPFFEEVSERQRRSAPHWGVLDGNAIRRLLALIEEVRGKRSRAA